jgi:3-hydroxyisobutyrate dehydrogenase/2-hydroxy-3-oxopropionate reductase
MAEVAGIVGVGRMGRAMARHLLAGGFEVVCTDVDAAALAAVSGLGAATAPTAAEVAGRAGTVFIAVGFDAEVAAALRGEDGVFAAAAPGTTVVVNSTVSPDLVRALGQEAAARGLAFLDIPIARGAPAAEAGTLLALAGGDAAILDRVRPMLATFCSDIAHLGEIGHGQVAKAVNNFLLWVDGVALMEAGRLAGTTGIDLKRLREALLMSSGRSWALENWDSVTFTWALKDMQIVSGLGDAAGGSFPLLGMVREQVKDARAGKARGEGPGWS